MLVCRLQGSKSMKKYSNYFLTALRILVGWHFLYEGIAKLMAPGWTAKGYLMGSKWFFAGIFHQMAASPEVMKAVDFLNIWGLILIGLSSFCGVTGALVIHCRRGVVALLFCGLPPNPGDILLAQLPKAVTCGSTRH